MNTTAYDKAYKALVTKGQKLTAAQLAARCGVSNPRDLVYRLRQDGNRISLKEIKNSRGEKNLKYVAEQTTSKKTTTVASSKKTTVTTGKKTTNR